MKEYTRDPCYPELVAILLAGAVHVILEFTWSFAAVKIWNAAVTCGFLGYLAWRRSRTGDAFRVWGMRSDNFFAGLRGQLSYVIPACILVHVYGGRYGFFPPKTFWLALPLYFLWGTAQQFALQNLLARNLRRLIVRPLFLALVSALLFSAAHFPSIPLMGLTLIAGFFFTWTYQRIPNLWAVGIAHGVLGAMVYYFVLHADPGMEILMFFRALFS